MREEEKKLAAELAAPLGLDCEFAVCRETLPPQALTAEEQIQLAALTHARRREEWLRGRNALKALRSRSGQDPDTSPLRFPHPHLSLTHSGGVAIAVGTRDPNAHGLGIDYEPLRPMRPESMRFFLRDDERKTLAMPAASTAILRLWVVKEAIFKADTNNTGCLLKHYRILDLHAAIGIAQRMDGPRKTFHYAVREWGGGFVGLGAVLRRTQDAASEPIS